MPAFDVLPFVPQIENPDSNILTDTLNWMPITGTYLANGGEQYVLLGNFKPVAEGYDTAYQYYGSPTHANWAYYYIDDVSLIDLDSTLSVKENEAMAQVEVFPNPASSVLTIKLNEPQQQYSITDIKGNTLLQNSLSKQEKLQIDISALPSGFYVINLINKLGYISREKFVKM
jgi:DNA-binding beta-propeller fold protein YncE